MPTLEYLDQGRSGYIVYKDKISTLQFYYEFGGGNNVAVISVPSANEWELQTKRSITERESILNFIAEQATRHQVRNGYYEIKDSFIEIFSNK